MNSKDHITSYIPYLLAIYGMIAIGIFSEHYSGFFSSIGLDESSMMTIFAIMYVVALVYCYILQYQVWRYVIVHLQNNEILPSVDTPGKAIGYQFIPFYNLYWVFTAYGKFAVDFNKLAERVGSQAHLSRSLGMTIAVMLILNIIPIINIIPFVLINFVLMPIFLIKSVNRCNELKEIEVVS